MVDNSWYTGNNWYIN